MMGIGLGESSPLFQVREITQTAQMLPAGTEHFTKNGPRYLKIKGKKHQKKQSMAVHDFQ